MRVHYNSKLAELVTFMSGFKTIMLFGSVFTEKTYLDGKTLEHEHVHCLQYWDCFRAGVSIGAIIMSIILWSGIFSWWLLTLMLIPALFYYAWYGIEYLVLRCKGYDSDSAYTNISFEKQAYWCSETWNKPYSQQNQYKPFGWMSYLG